MLRIAICVGSSCSVRGSDEFAAALERLLQQAGAKSAVELVGSFCMGQCSSGIAVRVGDEQYRALRVDDVDRFFREAVLPRIQDAEENA